MNFLILIIFIFDFVIAKAEDPTSQTIIKYEVEAQKKDGDFKVLAHLNNKVDGHRMRLGEIVAKKQNGFMCLQAAELFALKNQQFLRKENYFVYITYKQRIYNAKEINSGERANSRKIEVEILEMNSYGSEAKLVENTTTLDLVEEGSHRSVSGCKAKIEEAYRAAMDRVKGGKSRGLSNLQLKLVKKN